MKAETNQPNAPKRLLRIRDVLSKTGKSRGGTYADIAAGTFPAPVRIGVHSVAWLEEEVDLWIATRPRAGTRQASR